MDMKNLWRKARAKVSAIATATAAFALFAAQKTYAAANTGSTDLDTLIDSMETGAQSMKTGGMYIIAFIILIAVVLFGARWLWGVFRSWMASAK